MKKTDTSWNDLIKQRVIFSSVALKERRRICFHRILIENNTISSFSCSFISSNLLFPFFHSENDTMHQEEWMLFQSVMKRKYFTKKEAEFPQLEQDYVFSSFFIIRHTFLSPFAYSSLISFEHSLLKESTFFHSHSSSHFTHNILLTFDSVNRNEGLRWENEVIIRKKCALEYQTMLASIETSLLTTE